MANVIISKYLLNDEFMDDDEIIDLAMKCDTYQEFKEAFPEAYRVAKSRGEEYFNEVCSHMQSLPTRELTSEEVQDLESILSAAEVRDLQQIMGKGKKEIKVNHTGGGAGGSGVSGGLVWVPKKNTAKKKNEKIIPKKKKIDLMEFLEVEDVDVQYIEQGKYSDKIKDYIHKNNKQVKQINKAHENFITVMGDKMSSSELTYTRFKSIVDSAVKAMSEKNNKNLEVLKTLVVMDESNFSDDGIYENNFKLLDDNFIENEKNVSVVYEISLKLSQMKNKDSSVDHGCAIDELSVLQKNIDSYIIK